MKAKGFTLIELAVVLAVIAVLAAILTPLVTSYIDQARETRAAADARAIAQAYNLHRRDTGEFPIYSSAANAGSDTAAADFLSSDTSAEPTADTGVTGWTNLSTSGLIDTYLNQNALGLSTNNPRGGQVSYRGPYLDLLTADPWGNAYLVTAANLKDSSTNIGFVLSAGPDGDIDTDAAQASSGALTVGGDDIVARIR